MPAPDRRSGRGPLAPAGVRKRLGNPAKASPTVSVVVPTRNRHRMLRQSLRTILSQDADLEVVVVDEGSSDGTAQLLSGCSDRRVRTVRHDVPKGLPSARNAGIEASTGEVLAFCDDDDLWLPDKLALQLDELRRTDALWAVGGALTFTDGPRLLQATLPPDPRQLAARLPWENTVPGGGSNAIVARTAFERVGGFDTDPAIRALEDWDLWIRLAQVALPAVVSRPVVAYREHSANMSRNIATMVSSARAIEERYSALREGQPLDWVALHRWLGRMALRSGDTSGAVHLHLSGLRARHPGAARRLLRSLVPLRPRVPVTSPQDARDNWLDRIRPRQVVPWPEGVEDWLHETLGAA